MFNKTIISRFFIIAVLITAMVMISYSQSWQNLGGPPVADSVRDVSAGYKNGTFTIYAADKFKLSKSTDLGANWSFINAMNSPLLVACSPTNSDTVLVAKGRSVWLSTSGCNMFNFSQLYGIDPLHILYSRGAPRYVWVGTNYYENESSLKLSIDGGITYIDNKYFDGVQEGEPKTNVEDVWTVPNNPQIVWVAGSKPEDVTTTQGGVSGLWRCTNRGFNWSERNLIIHPQKGTRRISGKITAVTTNPSGDKVFFGNATNNDRSGAVYEYRILSSTSDTIIKISTDIGKINRLRAISSKLYIATGDGLYAGPYSSITKVDTIKGEVLSLDIVDINPTNPDTIIVGTNEYVYVSTDGGSKWSQRNPRTTFATLDAQKVVKVSDVLLARVKRGNYDVIYRYVAGNWTAVDMSFANKKLKSGIKEGDGFFVTSTNRVFTFGKIDDTKDSPLLAYSDNLGQIWTRVNLPQSSGIIYGMVSWNDTLFAYGDDIVIGTVKTNLIKSKDGINWFAANKIGIGTTLPTIYSFEVLNASTAFAGTSDGLYRTDNGGGAWLQHTSATNGKKKILSIKYSAPYIYCATPQGFFSYDFFNAPIVRTGIYKQVMNYNNDLYVLRERSSSKHDTIFKVTSNGTAWDTIPINRSAYNVRRFTISADSIYQATDNGIFSKHAGGRKTDEVLSPPIVGGSNPDNIVWESETTVLINGTPSIPEGNCLTIEPGVKVMFTPGSQLRIYGELNVQGTHEKKVRFVSESPSQRWGGIYVGKEAKANIEHAEISGSTFGIFVAKSDAEISNTVITNSLVGISFYGATYEVPTVDNCRIENNAWGIVTLGGSRAVIKNSIITGCQKGVLVDASSPEFYGNTISNNTQVGVVIYGYGYPRFGGIATNQPGSNTIQNNGITQILAVKGYAFLGYGSGSSMLGGANIITSSDMYAPLAVALDNSVISAMGTYWGAAPVNRTNFLVADLSQVIYEPVIDPQEIEQLLMDALQYRASGLYQQAIANYQQIISVDGTIIQALVELRETYADMLSAGIDHTSDWLSYLQTLQTHYNPLMSNTAKVLLAHEYTRLEMLNESHDKFNDVLTLGLDAESKISVMLSKLMLEGFDLSSEGEAEETYLGLKTQYPNDERTQLSQFKIELMYGAPSSLEFGKVSEFKVAMRELPKFPKVEEN